MTNISYIHATSYFTAHANYFWQWADEGRVIEFANRTTICYRDDLTFLLRELPDNIQAPLGSVLLLLCASKDNWNKLYELPGLLMRTTRANDFSSNEYGIIKQLLNDALAFMKVVNALPYELRSGMKRVNLLAEVLSPLPHNPDWGISVRAATDKFITGEIDHLAFRQPFRLTFNAIKNDLLPLSQAFELFPDVSTLEMKLRTGITHLPQANEVILPDTGEADLLTRLENNNATKGLALLARQIMAALHIPMHLSGSSEQLLGGVSDISNRGNFDKLLLSELAQDDTLLMARLANSEALFLQREMPPDRKKQELSLLIDTTLKMWGTPKVVAMAASVALHQSGIKNQQVTIAALGAKNVNAHAFDDEHGVIALLETLSPALHCGEALLTALSTKPADTRYLWLTSDENLDDEIIFPYYMRVKEKLSFIITVGRAGTIKMFKLDKGIRKLINQAQLDLNQLFAGKVTLEYRTPLQLGLPAIMNLVPFPIYYPASKVKMHQDYVWSSGADKVLVVTQDKRVLYWHNKDAGAVELLDRLPNGGFCIGSVANTIYIIVNRTGSTNIELFTFYLNTQRVEVAQLIKKTNANYFIRFINDRFYLSSNLALEIINPETLLYSVASDAENDFYQSQQKLIVHYKSLNRFKKIINNGYSVINSAKSIFVRHKKHLSMDRRDLIIRDGHIYWQENKTADTGRIPPELQETYDVTHLPNIKFTRFVWEKGGSVILDSRGILHFKSDNKDIPEISVVLIVDQPTACWSADGVVCGPEYFTGKTEMQRIPPALFAERYIQPFIDALQ